ncbi:amidophosphoribosyltransferase [Sinobacterium caligoides]|uniref:Amidophosphoribosyltransferase n=1 Tax=Sinobacterium caligoides TaxID=933926 RepID=A0A3N2DJI2_9GAMM|nr:amidophosphoribosyltransferase [Sinobacterium caligoides]ROR99960.1 amidophosphoribosyltransferase [Sinobacterium caligoides]
MCGIVGVVAKSNVNQALFDALTVLQHRGQDAAGMVTCDNSSLHQRKGNGLVRDVFRTRHMTRLVGTMGIAHIRYPTAGGSSPALAQPFYVNSPYGISLAHNGNLTNAEQLSKEVFKTDLRHMNTDSDSEVLLNVFAHEMQVLGKLNPCADDVFTAVKRVHQRCRGAYAVVAMIANRGMVAFRDRFGIRPLVIGQRKTDSGTEYMVASESVAIDVLGFEVMRDVAPGEAVYIDMDGNLSTQQCCVDTELVPCIFEQVYFARPDSVLDGVSVYQSRVQQGVKLAQKIQREYPNLKIDAIVPIPDSSVIAAQSMAQELGVKFSGGLVKNRYIGRTFIMPGQTQRKKSVRQKLNAVRSEFEGKDVLLVDDSIVRGTTSGQIIELVREAGANKVFFASAAPPVRYPNVYGIDMPSTDELIASGRTIDEVGKLIGADFLLYQDLDDLIDCSIGMNKAIKRFDCSVFNGDYVTCDIDEDYLKALHDKRNDATKSSAENQDESGDGAFLEIYNEATREG